MNNIPIGSKVLFLILLCGFFFAISEAGIHLYLDYKTEIRHIEEQILQVRDSDLKSITKSTWNLEADEVVLQLEGALKLRDIKYLHVKTETGEILAASGLPPGENSISRSFPLEYRHHGKTNLIGSLHIAASLEGVRERLFEKALIIVVSRLLIALLISGVFLIIFQRLVSRHLSKMARYTQNLDLNNLGSPLVLDRPAAAESSEDELEKVVQAINGMQVRIQEDITEIRQTKEILERSENKYRNLFESSMDAILVRDLENGYLDCNQAALKLFAIPSKEALFNLAPADLSPENQPDGLPSREKADLVIAEVLETGSTLFEWTHKRVNGEDFFASVLATRLELGGRTVLQETIRDISEYKQTQEMMVQSEKMMSVGGLAAGMAHEINNPLAGMLQNASLLSNRLSDLKMPANVRAAEKAGIAMENMKAYMERRNIPQLISAVNESGSRMADIVTNMLSFARISDAELSSHNLSDLLDKTLDLAGADFDLKKHFDFKKIEIEKDYDGQLPPVPCESAKIQQVLLNIFRNGAQAMQEANVPNPRFTIRTGLDKEKKSARLEIGDNGPGMNRKTRKRVFEPFFTTKPVGVGTGLGLSVSYFIITENHGGRMHVVSTLGKGTKFIIHLPLGGKSGGQDPG
ncbi:MAG: ATP-binding protein [Desulfobacterales bacterium]|nr:ATP-binding protein [Desulfobacterales bacterium]